MSEPFDFNLLASTYGHLKDQGIALQKRGVELVRIADSGISNIAPMQTLVETCIKLSQENAAARPALDFLYESGKHSLSVADNASKALQISVPFLESAITGVTFAATSSNLAAGTVVQELLTGAPDKKDVILSAWPPQGFARGFDDAALDTYLGKFDPALPRRRMGAWEAFYSASADALAQACHTMRDILAKIIAKKAANEMVEPCSWYKARKVAEPATKPTMKDRVRLLLYGDSDQGLNEPELDRMQRAVSLYVSDDGTLKQIAHGSTGYSREEAKLSMQNTEELLFLILRRLYAGS